MTDRDDITREIEANNRRAEAANDDSGAPLLRPIQDVADNILDPLVPEQADEDDLALQRRLNDAEQRPS